MPKAAGGPCQHHHPKEACTTSPWDRYGSPGSTGTKLIAEVSAMCAEPARLFGRPHGSPKAEIWGEEGGSPLQAPAQCWLLHAALMCQLGLSGETAGNVFQLEI